MNEILRKIKHKLYKFIFYIFFLKFKLSVKRKDKNFIFDIDNTLADTWPTLVKRSDNEYERLSNLELHLNVLNMVNEYIKAGEKVIFLTARDYRFYFVTNSWLKKHINGSFNLILVSYPYEKVQLLSSHKKSSFVLYDDMSFGHEFGEVKFYSEEINDIENLKNVEYVGYYDLLRIQGVVNEKNKTVI